MTFDEILAQVLALLQREKRVSYRALKRRFALDDDYLEDIKDELIYAKKLAVDGENRVLIWTGYVEGTADILAASPVDPIASSPGTTICPASLFVCCPSHARSRTPPTHRALL